jgi:importin subunit alpha-1
MDKEAGQDGSGGEPINRYALFIEEVGGMEKIHECQNNANEEIYMKAYNIIEKYFSDEEGEAENMGEAGPQVNQEGHFGFGAGNTQQQQQNFNFANGGDSMDM